MSSDRVSQYDYYLPKERIATIPAEPRDSARLFVIERETGKFHHSTVRELPSWLTEKTTIVSNNSRVRHGRVRTADGREVLILEQLSKGLYECIGSGKAPKVGATLLIIFGSEQVGCTVTATRQHPGMNTFSLRFPENVDGETLLQQFGEVPLPHYIENPHIPNPERYQTTFAKHVGSAAAPTAGLHISPELITSLEKRGHHWTEVTLHVGLGTFLPLRNEELHENHLHSEATTISNQAAEDITTAITNAEQVLAIGTTSLRTLEGNFNQTTGKVDAGSASVSLFITPGYHIRTASQLLTNFHLPKSSLLVLVTAFAMHNSQRELVRDTDNARELVLRAYQTAIDLEYRFYSFGDAMLLI
jgi:S-adenosylmethionine:tRNA ribosyltransferase-isomerase